MKNNQRSAYEEEEFQRRTEAGRRNGSPYQEENSEGNRRRPYQQYRENPKENESENEDENENKNKNNNDEEKGKEEIGMGIKLGSTNEEKFFNAVVKASKVIGYGVQ